MWIPENEYTEIKKKFPVPCVDLVISNEKNEVLLFKRRNEPAKGQWWFPGGRVNFGETLESAVHRKLIQECGASGRIMKTIGVFDILLTFTENGSKVLSHGISVFYGIHLDNNKITTDDQTEEYKWFPKNHCLDVITHPELKNIALKVLL